MRCIQRLSIIFLLNCPFLMAPVHATATTKVQLIEPCSEDHDLAAVEIEIDQLTIEVFAQCTMSRGESEPKETQTRITKSHPLTLRTAIKSPIVLEKVPRGLYREDMQLSITRHSSSQELVLDLMEDFGERCATLTISTADPVDADEPLLDRIKGLAWYLDSSCTVVAIQAENTIAVLPTNTDIQFALSKIDVKIEPNQQRSSYKNTNTQTKALKPIRKQGDVDIFRPCGKTSIAPSFDIHLLPETLRIAALCQRDKDETPVFSTGNRYAYVDRTRRLRTPFSYRQLKQDWRVTSAFNETSAFDTQILHDYSGSECLRIYIRSTKPAPYPKRFGISDRQLLDPVSVMFDKNCEVVAVQVLDQFAVFNTAKNHHFNLYGIQFEVKAVPSHIKPERAN